MTITKNPRAPKNSEPAPALRATAWSQLHIGSQKKSGAAPKKEPQLCWLFFERAGNFRRRLPVPGSFLSKKRSGAAPLALSGAGSQALVSVSAVRRTRLPKEPAPNWEQKSSKKSQNLRLRGLSAPASFFSKKESGSRAPGGLGFPRCIGTFVSSSCDYH